MRSVNRPVLVPFVPWVPCVPFGQFALWLTSATLFATLLGACGPSSFRDIKGEVAPDIGRRSPDGAAGRNGFGSSNTDAQLQVDPTEQTDASSSTPPADPAGPGQPPIDAPTAGDPGAPDAGVTLKPQAAPCGAAGECASGFCADGVCCASDCTERCFACNTAGKAGLCTAVAAGDDPRDDCATDLVATCGRDGTCDGAGACRLYPARAECAPGGCVGTTSEQAARLCDGKGVCQAAMTRSCPSSACQNGSCATMCANSDVCLPGFHCEDKTCKLKRSLGQQCTTPAQCSSNVCSGGVCCNIACDNKICLSCKVPGKVGTCSPAPPGDDPGDLCSTETASTCGRDGVCDGTGKCRLHSAGVECGAASCAQGAADSVRTCDGKGTCQASTRTSCGSFSCDGTRCATSCAPPATGCAPGLVCKENACVSDGLLLHWKFDEDDAAGTVAKDASSNGLDGLYVGPPTISPPVMPPLKFPNLHSRLFEASKRQAAVITPLPPLLKPTTGLTISVWYLSKGIEVGGKGAELVSLGNNQLLRLLPGGFEVSKRIKKGNVFEYVRCFSTPARTDHLDGKWHHLATVVDAASFRIFFDGVQVCTMPSADPLGYDINGAFTVGRHGVLDQVYDVDGNVDDVRIYGRALLTAEIMALAAGGP
jgi:hypothetical protein